MSSARGVPVIDDMLTLEASVGQQSWSERSLDAGRYWRYIVRQSVSFQLGAIILLLYVVMAIATRIYTPYDPQATFTGTPYTAPDAEHWFGTDQVGGDVFSRTLAAIGLDLGITLTAVIVALCLGTALGTIVGYAGGFRDMVIMRLLEIIQAFPSLLLAMIVVQAVGTGTANVIVVLAFVGLPYYTRLVRAEILSKRNWQFAEAARMVGNPPLGVAFRHLLPNSLGPVFAYTSINAAWVVLVTASLGFLGIGIEPGKAEWGAMISRGQPQIITGEWWISFFPGLAVLGLTAGFYLLGDGIRDVMDPRSCRRNWIREDDHRAVHPAPAAADIRAHRGHHPAGWHRPVCPH
jgi:ABC-type dipeptide/oligopeptide/nickel transport system permease subunit